MYTEPANVGLLLFAGGVTGVLGAMLGTGGGVFLIPILVLGFGLPIHYAVATSIVSVIATSSAAASANVERGTANMRLGMVLEIATALGAIAGGITAAWIPEHVIEGLFGLVLVPTGLLMWRGRVAKANDDDQREAVSATPAADRAAGPGMLGGVYIDEAIGDTVTYRVERPWAGFLVSLVAGNLSGLLGIGGGVFKVPALHLLCNVPIKAAAATSNFMIGVTAAASAFLYFGRGEIRPALTAAVVLGVLAGTGLGTQLNRRIHGNFIRRLFAVLLLAVAAQMLLRAVWRGV